MFQQDIGRGNTYLYTILFINYAYLSGFSSGERSRFYIFKTFLKF